ncbi:MAG: aldo/keto reductase [Cyanobacteriota bacterium]|nr:aldo/keto reductase [Cyanobacteriota bacterium]
MRTTTFANGDRMPLLGLGTWKAAPGEVGAAVREAIRLGYRHIDCASVYGNEPEVGAAIAGAIAAGEVRREELWITSKLWSNAHGQANVEPALRRTLADLALEWLDLYLVHWPVSIKPGVAFPTSAAELLPPGAVPLADTWAGMEAVLELGLTRHIGVSNISIRKLHDLLTSARHRPEVNQVERHPLLQQRELLAACAAAGVHITAYSPLGSGDRPAALKAADEPVLLDNPVIGAIAREHGCSPAQVLIAWQLQGGLSTLPKSVRPARLRENLEAADLQLSPADLERIAGLDQHCRLVDGSFWLLEGTPWTLQSLWDEG